VIASSVWLTLSNQAQARLNHHRKEKVQKVDVKFVNENGIEKQAIVAKNAQNMCVSIT
jgi:hypothetical protein